MGKGRIRKLFPGSNSSYGFFSHYDQIAGPEANRIIIFKGGPGTGKSSFMLKVGEALAEAGYDLEYHICSSANGSLDALYISEKGIAFMDGTSPHTVDPKYPGAVEEIINLGQYWERAKIKEQKSRIIGLQEEISRSFQQAYRMLAAAKLQRDAAENCWQERDEGAVLSLARDLLQKILPKEEKDVRGWEKPRTLFASAITPDGPVNYLGTLTGHLDHIYILNGENGAMKGKVVAKILAGLMERGYFAEVYPCAFDPHRIEHLIIPSLSAAIISSAWPHDYASSGADATIIDDELLQPSLRRGANPAAAGGDLKVLRESFQSSFHQAVSFLARAKMLHDELEGLYIPYMDFEQVDKLREKLLGSILNS